ncbi:protein PHLOEM protein 2-LIKE A2-like [Canna indica]|uniref:Protein PHLOEM protein 2-LIKE A2-like n=1 Tax=Canna indica TaxID=4628 RepID=A0AAQ3L2I9_9LILI|nr:protein PHLOEM protein 2-LIKE A2-like [Canna indica]
MMSRQGQAEPEPATNHSPHWTGDSNGGGWIKSSKDEIYISAKAMKITWGQDPRFWRWVQVSKDKLPGDLAKDELGFDSVAELVQVSWLEATGSVDLASHKEQLSPSKTYQVIFHVKF